MHTFTFIMIMRISLIDKINNHFRMCTINNVDFYINSSGGVSLMLARIKRTEHGLISGLKSKLKFSLWNLLSDHFKKPFFA